MYQKLNLHQSSKAFPSKFSEFIEYCRGIVKTDRAIFSLYQQV